MPNSHPSYKEKISKIGFYSPLAGVGPTCGYGYAAVQLIKSWQYDYRIPVWGYDNEAPVIFNFGQPQYYNREDGKLNIGYTPWESTKVPPAWLKYMNLMDEIWTTCDANAEWYKDAGVRPRIRVLHHGLNRVHWPLKRRRIGKNEPFRFLHVGEPSPRKGGELTYKVFRDTFGDRSDVHLTLKGKPRFSIKGDNVTVISDMLNQEELAQLHLDHHAMIYPTNGEGFGFIPFQAAATGMPTAVTNWSGPADYMKLCYPINPGELVVPFYEPHEGLWADPDPDSIAMWMRNFVESPNYYFSNAHRKVHLMDSYWSWTNIAGMALEFMMESLN